MTSKEDSPPPDSKLQRVGDIADTEASLVESPAVRSFELGTSIMGSEAESKPSGLATNPPVLSDPGRTPPTLSSFVNAPGTTPPTFDPATPGAFRSPEGYPIIAMTPPKMGVVLDFKRVKLGGEPKADWSGLALPSRGTPMCNRYASDSNEQKNYALRTSLPDFHFKKKCDLTDLMATLVRHLKMHGLDSVMYVPDPDQPGKVAFVPTDHTRLDWMKIRDSVDHWVTHCWDQYDLDNDAAVYELLLKICDKDMRRTINPYLVTSKKELPASVLLALITSQVEHVTRLTYPSMRVELMKKTPKSFTGVNIQMFNELIMPTLVKLEQSRQLTEEVMTWITNSFIGLGIDGFSNRLRDQFFDQVINCYEMQGDVNHTDMMTALRVQKIHWEDILTRAVTLYRNLVSYGQWPHKASTDSKAPPSSFNKVEEVLKGQPDLLKQFQALLAQTQREIKCHGCGKVGVKRPDCPNCKDKKGGSGGNGSNGVKGSANKSQDRPHDKWPAPKDGEPILKIHENRMYIFCNKCNEGKGRWQAHHKPKDHGNKDKKLTIQDLIELRKEFQASKTVPAEFNFCLPMMTDEGISL